MDVLAAIGAGVIVFPFVMVLALLATMWKSWWFYPAWAWFIAPLGVPAISFWHFVGLLLLVQVLTSNTDTHKDSRPQDWWVIAVSFLWPIAIWALLRWVR